MDSPVEMAQLSNEILAEIIANPSDASRRMVFADLIQDLYDEGSNPLYQYDNDDHREEVTKRLEDLRAPTGHWILRFDPIQSEQFMNTSRRTPNAYKIREYWLWWWPRSESWVPMPDGVIGGIGTEPQVAAYLAWDKAVRLARIPDGGKYTCCVCTARIPTTTRNHTHTSNQLYKCKDTEWKWVCGNCLRKRDDLVLPYHKSLWSVPETPVASEAPSGSWLPDWATQYTDMEDKLMPPSIVDALDEAFAKAGVDPKTGKKVDSAVGTSLETK